MNRTKTHILPAKSYSKWDDYTMLIKLRLSTMVVFTSLIGYVIASGGLISWVSLAFLALAGILVTGAANALNQVLEKDYDILMERTKDRPVAAGRMTMSEAVVFAGLSSMVGISILAMFNPLTALLGTLSLISYAFVYTPLKRYSTISVAIGAIPGALPVLIGFTAFSGQITLLAIGLFSIQFLWQFPHFWAIGYLAFEDYFKAGYKLLPETNGVMDRNVGLYAGIYALLAIPMCILLYTAGEATIVASAIGIICSVIYTCFSFNMYRKNNRRSALMLMFSSFFYLPIVLVGYMMT